MSPQGFVLASLTQESQRQLFGQLLSAGGTLKVVPSAARAGFQGHKISDIRDLSDQLGQARLRLAQTVQFGVPVEGQDRSYYPNLDLQPAPGDPPSYRLVERKNYGGGSDSVYGVQVRAEEPNEPKRGQLDLTAEALQARVPLGGLTTVGSLISRIGSATQTELYVDPRLEAKTLTLVLPALGSADLPPLQEGPAGGSPTTAVSPPATAPASDLLRALAFCLTATFRQVGPAYVLTDALAGVGTRRQTWFQFEQYGDALRAQTVLAAQNAVFTRHSPQDLSAFGDALAYTAAQDKPDPTSASFFLDSVSPGFHPRVSLPLARFTPAQQAAIRRISEQFNQAIEQHRMGGQPTSLEGNITMDSSVQVQLLLAGLDGPVDMDASQEAIGLFQAPDGVGAQRQKSMRAMMDQKYGRMSGSPPPPVVGAGAVPPAARPLTFAQALAVVPRRAVLVRARTAAQVDSAVAAMKALGLNQLWLDVFSDGRAHIPVFTGSDMGTSSSDQGNSNQDNSNQDILTEALAKTRGTGIQVFPVLSLLSWGQSPPAGAADLTILGETSAQAAARWQQLKALNQAAHHGMWGENTVGGVTPGFPDVAVCPLAPEVRRTLRALVGSLAAHPGVAGLVWRETDPPGYDLPLSGDDASALLVGYHEAMRLAFLRRYHADPLDVFPQGHYVGKANTDVANFSTDSFSIGQVSRRLEDEWRQFRSDAGLDLLRALWQTANPPGTPAPARHVILVKQRRRGQGGNDASGHTVYPPGWYGSWDMPDKPLPTLHTSGEDSEMGGPPKPAAAAESQAAAQSRVVYTPLTAEELPFLRERPELVRDQWRRNPPAGIVLDFSDAAPGQDPLADLAKGSRPPQVPLSPVSAPQKKL